MLRTSASVIMDDMERDAEKTRGRILSAALSEFATYGVAGGRVDRIAAAAGCNKQMIYLYFGSKDKLFETVYLKASTKILDEIEFTPYDLPGYIERLCLAYAENPHVVRLVAWCRLERQQTVELELLTRTMRERSKAVETAQNDGAVTRRFEPENLLALLGALALNCGLAQSGTIAQAFSERASREAVVRATRLLTDPANG